MTRPEPRYFAGNKSTPWYWNPGAQDEITPDVTAHLKGEREFRNVWVYPTRQAALDDLEQALELAGAVV